MRNVSCDDPQENESSETQQPSAGAAQRVTRLQSTVPSNFNRKFLSKKS